MGLDLFCNYIGNSKEVILDIIKEKVDKIVHESMNGFEEEKIAEYVEKTNKDFEEKFRKEDVQFTVTKEGNAAFIVDIQIPAGTEHFDTLVEIND